MGAAVSVVFGTLPVGFGFSVWPLLAVGPLVLVALLLALGRRARLPR